MNIHEDKRFSFMHLGNVCDQPRETSDGYHVGVFYVACELTFFYISNVS